MSVTVAANDKVQDGEQILSFDPALIRIDPQLQAMREWGQNRAHELSIPELAVSIGENGQDVACIVREDAEGYVLVAGHRRHAAVTLLREQAAEADKERGLELKVVVRDLTEDQAYQAAIRENVHRADFSPIELAHLVKSLRARYRWTGRDGTQAISWLLGMDEASVTQTEKLLTLPAAVQDKVRDGVWSKTTALELAAGKAEKREEVAQVAEQIAATEAEEGKAQSKKRNTKTKADPTNNLPPLTEIASHYPPPSLPDPRVVFPPVQGDVPVGTKVYTAEDFKGPNNTEPESNASVPIPRVETRHVRKAQELVNGAREKMPAPKAGELIDFFDAAIDTAAYPAVMLAFAQTFVAWAHGGKDGRRSAVVAAWDDIADALARATVVPTAQEKGRRKSVKAPSV